MAPVAMKRFHTVWANGHLLLSLRSVADEVSGDCSHISIFALDDFLVSGPQKVSEALVPLMSVALRHHQEGGSVVFMGIAPEKDYAACFRKGDEWKRLSAERFAYVRLPASKEEIQETIERLAH